METDTGGSPLIGSFIVDGGVGTEVSRDVGQLTVSIAPNGAVTAVDLLLDVTCTDRMGSTGPSGQIRIRLDLSGARDDGSAVPATVTAA